MTDRNLVIGFAAPGNSWHAMRAYPGHPGWAVALCNQYQCTEGTLTALADVEVQRATGVSALVGFCSTCRRTHEWRAARMDDAVRTQVCRQMILPWESVVAQLMTATGCDRAKAERIAEANGHRRPAPIESERTAAALEKDEQRVVARLFREFGFEVCWLSQPRASKQTPGIPDLWVMHPTLGVAFWMEVKRASGGRHSDAQKHFRDIAQRCGVGYVTGDRRAAESHLIHLGLARVANGALEPIRQEEVPA